MSAADFRRRVIDESGLGEPVPYVSVEIAQLLTDLLLALETAEAVVAAQREALQAARPFVAPVKVGGVRVFNEQAAVDDVPRPASCPAPGAIEPFDAGWNAHRLGMARETVEVVSQDRAWALLGYDARTAAAPLTSPVDTAPLPCTCHTTGSYGCPAHEPDPPRGYVEHGPGGPQAVYHAETPDAYLAKGDRP